MSGLDMDVNDKPLTQIYNFLKNVLKKKVYINFNFKINPEVELVCFPLTVLINMDLALVRTSFHRFWCSSNDASCDV